MDVVVMAPSSVVAAPLAAPRLLPLPDVDPYELRQCQRIVQFRDAIFAGSHSRIKIPPHLVGKLTTTGVVPPAAYSAAVTSCAPPGPELAPVNQQQSGNSLSFNVNQQQPPVFTSPSHVPTSADAGASAARRGFEFDPDLSSEQADGANVGILLRRQALEQILREQVDKHKTVAKIQQSDVIVDIDFAELLQSSRALAATFTPVTTTAARPAGIVTAVASPAIATTAATANQTERSGAFATRDGDADGARPSPTSDDDESFYSSQDESSFEVACHPDTSPKVANEESGGINGQHDRLDGLDAGHPTARHGWKQAAASSRIPKEAISKETISREETLKKKDAAPSQNGPARTGFLGGHAQPQPKTQSQPQTVDQPQRPQPSAETAPAAPAQVASLRNELLTAGSSPDSSPRGARSFDRRKGKKKLSKRKADKVEAEDSATHVKSEPESPSPLDMVPFHRPHKRQKHSDRSDPIRVRRREEHRHQHYSPHGAHQEQYAGHTNDRIQVAPPPQSRNGGALVVAGTDQQSYPPQDYPGDYYSYSHQQMPSPSGYVVHQQHPRAQAPLPPAAHVPAGSGYLSMPHSPHFVVEAHRPDARYYSAPDPQFGSGRVSMRPSGGAMSPIIVYDRHSPASMPPPRLPPTLPPARIIVDAYGREYVERFAPEPAPTTRRPAPSVAPPGEPETAYVPGLRGATPAARRPGFSEVYGDAGAMHSHGAHGLHQQPPAPTYLVPRRVVAQPDAYHTTAEGRPYAQREYSVRPMAPPSGTEEFGEPQRYPELSDTRPVDGQYHAARSASVRPSDPVQYEMREYERQPVHGQYSGSQYSGGSWVREYRPSVPADASSRALAYPFVREYSVRPAERRPTVVRELSVRPSEPHYGEHAFAHDARAHGESAGGGGGGGGGFRRPGMGREQTHHP